MADSVLKDKIPPHSIEAEQAVLGALLLDWNAMADIVTLLHADRFYSLQNQIIYEAMIALFSQSVKGDTLTVCLDTASLLLCVDGYTRDDYLLPLIGCDGNYHCLDITIYREALQHNMALRAARWSER